MGRRWPGLPGRRIGGHWSSASPQRMDFGIDAELPLDGGGVVIGDTMQISLDNPGRAGELTSCLWVVAQIG